MERGGAEPPSSRSRSAGRHRVPSSIRGFAARPPSRVPHPASFRGEFSEWVFSPPPSHSVRAAGLVCASSAPAVPLWGCPSATVDSCQEVQCSSMEVTAWTTDTWSVSLGVVEIHVAVWHLLLFCGNLTQSWHIRAYLQSASKCSRLNVTEAGCFPDCRCQQTSTQPANG